MILSTYQRTAFAALLLSASVISSTQDKSAANNGGVQPESKLVSASVTSTAQPKPAAVSEDYKVGPGDLLAVHIWKEPDLSRNVLVRPDGKLSMPLIGEMMVKDDTVTQLKTKLTAEYQKYINNPEITVTVQEARSHRFNVVGQVQRPGSFVITQPTTVLDAIALVGGFRDFAKTKKIYVLRAQADGTTKRLPFDYNKVLKGQNWEQNVQLQSGDTIVVP